MSDSSKLHVRTHSYAGTFRFSGLLKKELREILRDRRTIITLFVNVSAGIIT
ncbi:MAG: hypothetical protein K0U82_04730 [Planctomycetes bacterium]|nr:hypothetical protein [Planctomycetota bacterium]